jgi:hypothetical protein
MNNQMAQSTIKVLNHDTQSSLRSTITVPNVAIAVEERKLTMRLILVMTPIRFEHNRKPTLK